MACIGKIALSLTMPCGAPAEADLGRPLSAKILNASDIASYTIDTSTGAAKVTRLPGSRGWELTAVNDSLVITVGLKSQDITPGAYDVAITFKPFSGAYTVSGNSAPLAAAGSLARAELVFAVKHEGGIYRIYGLGAPLVCTEISGDSSASAFITYTYGVEDWQVGTTIHRLGKADYDALSTPEPVPEPEPDPDPEPEPAPKLAV